jgi:hypothetical protein
VKFENRWPEEHEKMLIDLWNKGLSGSQIAAKISEAGFPVTRMAVLGKKVRLKLSNRQTTMNRHFEKVKEKEALACRQERESLEKQKVKDRSKPTIIANSLKTPPYVLLPEEEQTGILLVDLEKGQCRWPIKNHRYCGEPILEGSRLSYCRRHYDLSVRS